MHIIFVVLGCRRSLLVPLSPLTHTHTYAVVGEILHDGHELLTLTKFQLNIINNSVIISIHSLCIVFVAQIYIMHN